MVIYRSEKPNLIYTMTVRKDAADEKAKVYARNTIVFDDLEGLQGAAGAEFAVTSPVSYRGRNRTAANAYHLWGFCIDLDGVGMDQMHDLLYQIQNDVLLTPTYLINSGHGFHVYYLLEEPIPLYKHLHRPLNDLKHWLNADSLERVYQQHRAGETAISRHLSGLPYAWQPK